MKCEGIFINNISHFDECVGHLILKAKNGRMCFVDYKKGYRRIAYRYARAFLRDNLKVKDGHFTKIK